MEVVNFQVSYLLITNQYPTPLQVHTKLLPSEVRNWSESTLNHRNAFAMVPVTL
jgi:hypothetical protein